MEILERHGRDLRSLESIWSLSPLNPDHSLVFALCDTDYFFRDVYIEGPNKVGLKAKIKLMLLKNRIFEQIFDSRVTGWVLVAVGDRCRSFEGFRD